MYNEKSCWLCGRNGAVDPLDKHHIFPNKFRNKSERDGAYVYLCHGQCHIFGKNAAHKNPETMLALKRYGQRMLMDKYGWTTEDFVREYGKNYL